MKKRPLSLILSLMSCLALFLTSACITVEARVAAPVQQGDVAQNAESSLSQLDSESLD